MRQKDPELMKRILEYVTEYYLNYSSTPSTTQIANEVGIASGTAYKYLVAMDERGMIKYQDGDIVTTSMEKIATDREEVSALGNFEYDKITIKNLLMHRSGLVSDLFYLILDKTRDYHEVIPGLRETYLTAEPGKMFSYSNVGYTVLGIIIERVSGLSYKEYIQREIAKPLGIQIHFLLNEEDRTPFIPHISLCYDKKGKAVEDSLSTLLPAGSNSYMSLSDFVKFGQMFLKKDNVLVKRETLELMETLNLEDPIDKEVYNVGFGLIHKQYDMGEQVGKVLEHGGNTTDCFGGISERERDCHRRNQGRI